jgi:hypothetical protein
MAEPTLTFCGCAFFMWPRALFLQCVKKKKMACRASAHDFSRSFSIYHTEGTEHEDDQEELEIPHFFTRRPLPQASNRIHQKWRRAQRSYS